MMRKLYILLMFIPLLYMLTLPVYLTGIVKKVRCQGLSIDLADSSDYHFITKRSLANIVYSNSGKILGRNLKDLPLPEIENRVRELGELRVAEAYTSADGKIHLFADQRDPVMRVIPAEGGDFFLDEDGVLFRKRNLYNPRLHVIGGNVTISQAMLNGVSVLDTSIKKSVLKDIYQLVRYISKDDFWSAQIDQVYVDGDNEIDLIPRVGNQLIHLGTTENLEGKLRNLAAFYDKVLPEVGWNRYSLINLEYKDQIVCKKRDNQN